MIFGLDLSDPKELPLARGALAFSLGATRANASGVISENESVQEDAMELEAESIFSRAAESGVSSGQLAIALISCARKILPLKDLSEDLFFRVDSALRLSGRCVKKKNPADTKKLKSYCDAITLAVKREWSDNKAVEELSRLSREAVHDGKSWDELCRLSAAASAAHASRAAYKFFVHDVAEAVSAIAVLATNRTTNARHEATYSCYRIERAARGHAAYIAYSRADGSSGAAEIADKAMSAAKKKNALIASKLLS